MIKIMHVDSRVAVRCHQLDLRARPQFLARNLAELSVIMPSLAERLILPRADAMSGSAEAQQARTRSR